MQISCKIKNNLDYLVAYVNILLV